MDFNEVVFTKVSQEVRRHHRRFFERHVRRMFIKYLAYTNQFDGVLNDREIAEAKLGHLPADLDVHHIFPISGSASEDVNSFGNLSVLHKTTHVRINREIFAPQLKDLDRLPEGAKQVDYWQNPAINQSQKQAVEKILAAPDICLIQGPPGTGKTTVIAEAIWQLVLRGQRVLISS